MKKQFCFLILLLAGWASAPTGRAQHLFSHGFGARGAAPGELNYPWKVAVDPQWNMLVVDRNNNRIQKYDAQGRFLFSFGSGGSDPGQFNVPYDVDLDAEGNIYVVDPNNNRVQKFDQTGQFLLSFGSEASGPGRLSGPLALDQDRQGNLYVLSGGWVKKFDRKGQYISGFQAYTPGDVGKLFDLLLGPDGNVFVMDEWKNRVKKFDPAGNLLLQFGTGGSGDGQFRNAYCLAMDRKRRLYVSDHGNNRVQVFSEQGHYLTQINTKGDSPGDWYGVVGITLGPDGTLYAADANNTRVKIFAPLPEVAVKQGATEVPLSSTFEFGTLGLQTEQRIAFSLTNTGLAPFTLDPTASFIVDGTDGADFSVEAPQENLQLAPDGEAPFTLTFRPTAAGQRVGKLNVYVPGHLNPVFTLNLVGIGEQALGTDHPHDNATWKAYPNPATEELKVQLPAGTAGARVVLYNALGQVVHRQGAAGSGELVLAVGQYPKGVYVLQVHLSERVLSRRIVLQ